MRSSSFLSKSSSNPRCYNFMAKICVIVSLSSACWNMRQVSLFQALILNQEFFFMIFFFFFGQVEFRMNSNNFLAKSFWLIMFMWWFYIEKVKIHGTLGSSSITTSPMDFNSISCVRFQFKSSFVIESIIWSNMFTWHDKLLSARTNFPFWKN